MAKQIVYAHVPTAKPQPKTTLTTSTAAPAKENVNHPAHYNLNPSGVECITVVQHMNFNVGNAMKYLWRSDHKGGVEDLHKARFYIEQEIKRLQNP